MITNSHRKFDVNRIRVAKPCSVPWESMSGDERKRMCGECGLHVHNVSELTENEVAQLIGDAGGDRVCVRMFRRSDNTVITSDCPRGLAAYRRRISRVATAAFASVIGLFAVSASAQRGGSDDGSAIVSRSRISFESTQLVGTVRDQSDAVIPGAKVTLTTSSGKTYVKTTDDKGRFRFSKLTLVGRNKMYVSMPGFQEYQDEFVLNRRETATANIILTVGATTGIVVIDPQSRLIDMGASDVTTSITVSRP